MITRFAHDDDPVLILTRITDGTTIGSVQRRMQTDCEHSPIYIQDHDVDLFQQNPGWNFPLPSNQYLI